MPWDYVALMNDAISLYKGSNIRTQYNNQVKKARIVYTETLNAGGNKSRLLKEAVDRFYVINKKQSERTIEDVLDAVYEIYGFNQNKITFKPKTYVLSQPNSIVIKGGIDEQLLLAGSTCGRNNLIETIVEGDPQFK